MDDLQRVWKSRSSECQIFHRKRQNSLRDSARGFEKVVSIPLQRPRHAPHPSLTATLRATDLLDIPPLFKDSFLSFRKKPHRPSPRFFKTARPFHLHFSDRKSTRLNSS